MELRVLGGAMVPILKDNSDLNISPFMQCSCLSSMESIDRPNQVFRRMAVQIRFIFVNVH